MATNNFTNAGDDAADAVARGGEQAGAGARQAGSRVGEAVDEAAKDAARHMRSTARRGASVYDEAVDEIDGRARSLEDTIRENPLAAAGAALLVGVVLGRFIL
jgi:hypothetical protein